MALSDEYARLPLEDIQVDRANRQRQKVEIEGLKSSIAARGVMNPIIVRRVEIGRGDRPDEYEFWLIAGECRLEASRALGLPDIPVRFADQLSPVELQIIELEENLKRKDLHWTEMVEGMLKVHELYLASDPEWTTLKTAAAIGIHPQNTTKHLRVASAIRAEKADGRKDALQSCPTFTSAYERLSRMNQRAGAEALAALLDEDDEDDTDAVGGMSVAGVTIDDAGNIRNPIGPIPGGGATVFDEGDRPVPLITMPTARLDDRPRPSLPPSNAAPRPKPEPILNEDFVAWSDTYAGPKFNFIHCDFPYGVDVFKGRMERTALARDFEYEDSREIFEKLLDALFANSKHLLASNAHLMFWLPAKLDRINDTIAKFAKYLPQFEFWPHPLIWHKSDNAGQFPNPNMGPRHTYEVALLAQCGGRKIVQMVADSYSGPTNNVIHPSAKPAPMLQHFFRMLVDDTTRMLDPTCGSGTSVAIAEGLDATLALGLELDPAMANSAKLLVKSERERRKKKVLDI